MRRAALAAILALVALAFAPQPARAFGKNKIAYRHFDWHTYRAPHFDVFYYPEEEALLDEIVSYSESQYLRLSQTLDSRSSTAWSSRPTPLPTSCTP